MHVGVAGADKTHTPKGAESAFGESRGSARKFAHAMIDAGASAVLGSGPHVVRGAERYKGRLIAYSLGDFADWGNFKTTGTYGLSGLLTIRINGDGETLGGRWTSLQLDSDGAPYVDDTGESLTLVRALSRADFKSPWPMRETVRSAREVSPQGRAARDDPQASDLREWRRKTPIVTKNTAAPALLTKRPGLRLCTQWRRGGIRTPVGGDTS